MILPVDEANVTAWAELCTLLWPEHQVEDMLRLRIEDNLQDEYLYLHEGEAVGFISLSLRTDYVEGTSSHPVGYVEGLFVKKAYRSQGIARKLVEFAKQWALERGASELASDVELDNQVSQKFHEAIGFTEANRIVCYTMKLK